MIYKYLSEIKFRAFFSIFCWGFVMINCYYFKEILLYAFIRFASTFNKNVLLFFLTTDVSEVFLTYIKLSYYIANQLVLIFIFCQFFFFLSSGFYIFEYVYLKTILIFAFVLWIFFLFLLNSFIFPVSWNFFFKFQEFLSFKNLTFYFEAKLSEYFNFYKSTFHLCMLFYQFAVLFFIFLDLFKTNLLIVKNFKKSFYFIFLICSTLVTPPEVVYQVLISIFIITIYELLTINMILKIELMCLRR